MNVNAARHRFIFLQIAAIALLLAAMTGLFSFPSVTAQESDPQPTSAPTVDPTPEPTPESAPEPTPAPTAEPTPEATPEPTPESAPEPTLAPTAEPTPEATPEPTPEATPEPTPEATPEPTPAPIAEPTPEATPEPTPESTPEPTPAPTAEPTPEATPDPTPDLTPEPTPEPTPAPTPAPTPEATPEPTPEPALRRARKNSGSGERKPFNVSISRAEFSESSSPALDVQWINSWAEWHPDRHPYWVKYRKSGETNWTDHSKEVRLLTARLTGLEAATTYEVQVKQNGNECTDTGITCPWSDTVSAKTNTAPSATDLTLGDAWNIGLGESANGGISGHFTDEDGDPLTYQVWSGSPALLSVETYDDGNGPRVRARVLNPGTSTFHYRARDAYGGQSATKSHQVNGTANVTRTVAENSPAGTAVGNPVTGTPYDDGDPQTDDTLTHTLTGEAADSGVFTIDAASGQIRVADCGALDYETKISYAGKVNWTVNSHAAVANLTINVTDVNPERLCPPGAPALTRTEFSEQSAPALGVTWAAPPGTGATVIGYEAQYRKQGATVWATAPLHSSGPLLDPLLLRDRRLSDLEAGATYEARVRALSDNGPSPWSDVGEGKANRPPAVNPAYAVPLDKRDHVNLLSSMDFEDYEIKPPGKRLFLDPDGDALAYSTSAQYPGILEARMLNAQSDRRFLRGLNPGSSNFTDYASDGYGGVASLTSIFTASQNETRAVAENSPAGTLVGDPVTGRPYDDGDPETDDSLTYTLTGEAASAFVIDSATGQISVAEGATLDYETKSSYTGQVNWEVQGQAAAADLTINVTDVAAGQPGTPTLTRTQFEVETPPALDVTWAATDANGFTITGYGAQYRIKVAESETENAWTAYNGTLAATDTTLNLPGLTPGATYEVQVRALTDAATNGEDVGPWSNTGEGRANRPPTVNPDGPAPGGGPYTTRVLYSIRLVGEPDHQVHPYESSFLDGDGDTLTYSSSAEHPGILQVAMNENIRDLRFLTFLNPATTKLTDGASDGYGGYVSRTATVTGQDLLTREVAENSPAGTNVGDPVTGTPYDDGNPETDDSLGYKLTGEAASAFDIDSATGQVSVKPGETLDYETKKSYTGQVNWTIQGQPAAADLTINVTDVEVTIPSAPTVTRTPSGPPMNPALDVTWTAADGNGLTVTGYNVQYRVKVEEDQTPNDWTAYTYTYTDTSTEDPQEKTTSLLLATDRTVTLPNLEAGATYEVQVRALTDAATNGEDVGPWSNTREGRANRPPTVNPDGPAPGGGPYTTRVLYSIRLVGEPDHQVHPYESSFLDGDGDTLTYSSSAEHPGILQVAMNENIRDLRFLTFLNPATTKLTDGASDGYGGYVSRTATVTGQDLLTREVAENSPAGTNVGDPVTGTPYDDGDDSTDDALTYRLTWDTGHEVAEGLFVIDSSTGQISLAAGATLDYESGTTSYDGKVNWTVQGQPAAADLTINVTDVEAVMLGAPTVTRTPSGPPMNPALDVTWTAADGNGLTVTGYNVQYRVKVAQDETENAWTLYEYDDPANPGTQISNLPATDRTVNLPNLTAGATYEAQVRALTNADTNEEDVGPWSDIGEGRANRLPAVNPDAPTPRGSDHVTGRLYHDRLGGQPDHPTTPTQSVFLDEDGDALTYSSFGTYPGVVSVTMSENPSDLRLIEFLNPGTTKLTAVASDGYGGYAARNEIVSANDPQTREVAENSPAGTLVGSPVTGTPYDYDGDPETDDDALTYSLTWDSGHEVAEDLFVINSATGQISVTEGASLDFETTSSYTGKVNWTIHGQAVFATLTINVTDVEATLASAPTLTRTQFWVETPPALDVTWTAADGNGLTVTGYELQYRKQGETENAWTLYKYKDPENAGSQISKLSAETTSVNLPDLEAGETYEVQVRAVTSSSEGEGPWSELGEGRANRAPNVTQWFFLDATFDIGESHLNTLVGYFEDADADTLRYAVSADNPGVIWTRMDDENPAFMLNDGLNPGTAIVTYGAHDDYGGYANRTVTITVRNGNVTRSVAERSSAGTLVGEPVTGTPYGGEAFTYTLTDGASGDATSAFVIDSVTGQIKVKQGATLDYETKASYTGQVSYTVEGHPAAIDLTINVTDVNETPAPRSSPRLEPTPEPAPAPTPEPTPAPTPEPTPAPTPEPTPAPTPEPTPAPTPESTPAPTPEPTPAPTLEPTPAPTPESTPAPTPESTPAPTLAPTPAPTPEPTPAPTPEPTPAATSEPTAVPTSEPTPALAAESTNTSTPRPSPGLSLLSNPGVPDRILVGHDLGQAGLALPVRLESHDEFANGSTSGQVVPDEVATRTELGVSTGGFTSPQVNPDSGPVLSSPNLGYWIALSLPLLLLPLLFLMRRRRMRKKGSHGTYPW